jgi:hypothetical protein
MRAHRVARILTFNTQDYARYKDANIEAVNPTIT